MPAPLAEPVLTLAYGNLQKLQQFDQCDLSAVWTLFTKCKDNLENGRRLENISWRLWYRSTHSSPSDGRRNQEDLSLPECLDTIIIKNNNNSSSTGNSPNTTNSSSSHFIGNSSLPNNQVHHDYHHNNATSLTSPSHPVPIFINNSINDMDSSCSFPNDESLPELKNFSPVTPSFDRFDQYYCQQHHHQSSTSSLNNHCYPLNTPSESLAANTSIASSSHCDIVTQQQQNKQTTSITSSTAITHANMTTTNFVHNQNPHSLPNQTIIYSTPPLVVVPSHQSIIYHSEDDDDELHGYKQSHNYDSHSGEAYYSSSEYTEEIDLSDDDAGWMDSPGSYSSFVARHENMKKMFQKVNVQKINHHPTLAASSSAATSSPHSKNNGSNGTTCVRKSALSTGLARFRNRSSNTIPIPTTNALPPPTQLELTESVRNTIMRERSMPFNTVYNRYFNVRRQQHNEVVDPFYSSTTDDDLYW